MKVFINNKKWKVNLYRVIFIISIIGISLFVSETISDYLSSFLFHNKPYGSLLDAFVGMILFILEGFSYVVLKWLLVILFSLAGWFLVSRFIEKTATYNYILCRTDKLSMPYGWFIWIGFSSLPLLLLYLTSSFEVMKKPAFNNIYKHGLVKLNGHIDKTLAYKIQTTYLARNNSRKCIAKLTDRVNTKVLNIEPHIIDTLHEVTIPLDTVKENFCDYQIHSVDICLTRKAVQNKLTHKFNCYTLFELPRKADKYVEYNETLDYRFMPDGHIYKKMENDKLSIYCSRSKYKQQAGTLFCTQDQQKKKSITQYLQTGIHSYLINIYDE